MYLCIFAMKFWGSFWLSPPIHRIVAQRLFRVAYKSVTRLGCTKQMMLVNGQFPGPTIHAKEGDTLLISVTNLAEHPLTIHWHGVKQIRTCWADGVPYITQCPLQKFQSYTHRFWVQNQTGTLWYHAHTSWLRASIHGALIVQPHENYPFPQPNTEVPIILGEWWNEDVEEVIARALARGGSYNLPNALTINGQPGFLYNSSAADAYRLQLQSGHTYLLRLVNACMNFALFFAVAKHRLTVVKFDSAYVVPFTVNVILIQPGQTLDALLTASHQRGRFYMAASVFSMPNSSIIPFPTIPATALLEYPASGGSSPIMPRLPSHNDSSYRDYFEAQQFTLNNSNQLLSVPKTVDRHLFYTVGYGLASNHSCPPLPTCDGINGNRLRGSVNNITFNLPTTARKSLLEYGYLSCRGVLVSGADFNLSFPDQPDTPFDYTGPSPPRSAWYPEHGTRLSAIRFNSSVQLILQDTSILEFETHPFHLHGYSVYIVGKGYGNYDPATSPASFNLINPPLRNTYGVPSGGWLALRFVADNPGVWLLHCHLEIHTSWGMETAFFVREGNAQDQWLPSPPRDYPRC
ncbi:unnamed protein product [Sphagnum jensenii]|uniref:Laccase n=1 Tax=Sphagnum jensenii TaxID=128206 RepID=A0ABP1BIT8_9BRYO